MVGGIFSGLLLGHEDRVAASYMKEEITFSLHKENLQYLL